MTGGEYRILEVRLENYRQYYDTVTAKFAGKEGVFSVFIGENGEGKSNLLNAINWCLFAREPHKRKEGGLPIINTRRLDEASMGSKITMSATVILQRGVAKYSIARRLAVIKRNPKKQDGQYIVTETNTPVPEGFDIDGEMIKAFLRSTDGGTWEDQTKTHNFDSLVSGILPENLSEFFMLDGEFMERLFDRLDKIGSGVMQISQLSMIENAVSHIQRHRLRNPLSVDVKLNEMNELLKGHERALESLNGRDMVTCTETPVHGTNDRCYHVSGKPRVNDLKDGLLYVDGQLDKIRTRMRNTNAKSNFELQERLEYIEVEIAQYRSSVDELESEHRTLLITEGPKIMLSNALKNTVAIVEKEIEAGTLPNRVKMNITTDLLYNGTCLCGTSLEEGSGARRNVEETRSRVSDDVDLDIANDIKIANDQSLELKDKVLKKIDETVISIYDLNEKLAKHRLDRSFIKEKLKDTGDDSYARLHEQEGGFDSQRDWIKKELHDEEIENKRRNAEIGEMRRKITNLNVRDSEAKRVKHKLAVSETACAALENVNGKISEHVRERVQEKTTEFFKKISWKEGYFDRIIIDQEYKLKLITVHGYNAINDLSAGEKLFLALSFIAALRQIAGYTFPLVVDTPLGKISGTPRRMLADKISYLFPQSQLTLLATDTEYLLPLPDDDQNGPGESFRDMLKKKVSIVESRIKFNRKTFCAEIMPYGSTA